MISPTRVVQRAGDRATSEMVQRRSCEYKPGYGIESGEFSAAARLQTLAKAGPSGAERMRYGGSETTYRKLENARVLNVNIDQESVVNLLDPIQYQVLSWQDRLRMARRRCHAS